MSNNEITPESSIRLIAEALLPVVQELEPHAVPPTQDELEQAAAQLVMELCAKGFSVIPKVQYDELVVQVRDSNKRTVQ